MHQMDHVHYEILNEGPAPLPFLDWAPQHKVTIKCVYVALNRVKMIGLSSY